MCGVGKRVISGSILLILGVFARSAHGWERTNILRSCNLVRNAVTCMIVHGAFGERTNILRSCNLKISVNRQEAWMKEAVAANEVCLSLT